jgi:hypothetical protein
MKPLHKVVPASVCCEPKCALRFADQASAEKHVAETGHDVGPRSVRKTFYPCEKDGCTTAGESPAETAAMHKKNGGCK